MKYLLLSGTDGNVAGAPFLDSERYVRAIGKNSGNLVFQYAVKRLLAERCDIIGQEMPYHMGMIQKHGRAVVIPSSNFLREDTDFSKYVGFLERTELPLVFLGLGAQADSVEHTRLNLHPSVLRLIDLIRERAKKVSVRGRFTAEILSAHGVSDVVVTGCPSNFINPDPGFAEAIAKRAAQAPESFIAQAEAPWSHSEDKLAVDRRLMAWTRASRSIMVQQSVPPVLEYLRRNNPAAGFQPDAAFETGLKERLMPDADLAAFRRFCLMKMRTYASVDQWMEDSARFDFSVGMRLHGNMAAWQAGTPALWIHHDARTRELVETMALPNISVSDFLNHCGSIKEAHAMWNFDPAAYLARRSELRAAFNSVLEAHDIAVADTQRAA